MHLRPFTKDDWDGFAGCDSKYPFTCDNVIVLDVVDGHDRLWTGLLVVDNNIVQIHLYRGDDDDELILHCEFDSTEQAITWVMNSDSKRTMQKLMATGFKAL